MNVQVLWVVVMSVCQGLTYELGWSNWTSCSVTCGTGLQHRGRICVIQVCPESLLNDSQTVNCSLEFCPQSESPQTIANEQPTINKEKLILSPTTTNLTRTTSSNPTKKPKEHRVKHTTKAHPTRRTTKAPTTRKTSKAQTTRRTPTTKRTTKSAKKSTTAKAKQPTTKSRTRTPHNKATNPAVMTGPSTTSSKRPWKSQLLCTPEEQDGISWPETPIQNTAVQPCPQNSRGNATRPCRKREKQADWGEVNLANCVSTYFLDIQKKLRVVEKCASTRRITPAVCSSIKSEILDTLVNETAKSSSNRGIQGGDLKIAVDSLMVINSQSKGRDFQTNRHVIDTASNLLNLNNVKSWRQVQEKETRNLALEMVNLLEDVGFKMAEAMVHDSNGTLEVKTSNIAMRIDSIGSTTTQFVTNGLTFRFKNTSIEIPADLFLDNVTTKAVTIIYPTLSHVLSLGNQMQKRKPLTTIIKQAGIKSDTTVVSSTVSPRRKKLVSPIKIIVKNFEFTNTSRATCVSWTPGNSQRAWSSYGCQLVPHESDEETTTCICNHMTLFAALMDPYGTKVADKHRVGLEIVSLVGCSISLIAIFATFVITLFHWQKLKSPRSEILLNICFAIAAVCTLVLVEQTARENKIACSLVATLLHYFLLAVFTWMLCEGVLLRMVFFSDITGSGRNKMRHFYIFGWGFPVIIVSLSIGATRFEGYGKLHVLCWLSTENGLSWAFVVPAIFVVLINSMILASIMKRMLGIRQMKKKKRTERIRLGVKAMVVIMPLLGITWVFGLLAFNSDTIAFKYLFSIFNSLQGVMIFVFHCVLDNKVQEVLNTNKKRRQSMPMSITRVRPAGKDEEPHEAGPISPVHVKMFPLDGKKLNETKDLSQRWDNLWGQKIEHPVEEDVKQEHVNTNQSRARPRSSTVFELSLKDHQVKIADHQNSTP